MRSFHFKTKVFANFRYKPCVLDDGILDFLRGYAHLRSLHRGWDDGGFDKTWFLSTKGQWEIFMWNM